MEIKITTYIKCLGNWNSKCNGVVLVKYKKDIEPLWKLLCEQDEYWKSYKELIKVAPKQIDSLSELNALVKYCGKTDIYNIEELKKKIPFMIYQTFDYD